MKIVPFVVRNDGDDQETADDLTADAVEITDSGVVIAVVSKILASPAAEVRGCDWPAGVECIS